MKQIFISLSFVIVLAAADTGWGKVPSFSASELDPSTFKIEEDKYLGKTLPDIKMLDETGNAISLSKLSGKPLIISLIYFTCPHVCLPLNEALAEAAAKINDLRLGQDYNILTLSFSKYDTPQRARDFRRNLQRKSTMPQSAERWVFATAGEDEIKKLTDATGYMFFYSSEDNVFAHPSVYIFVSPDRKVMRYLYGANPDAFDVKMALLESTKGKIGKTTVSNLVTLVCYKYDAKLGVYTIDITALFASDGGVMILMTGIISLVVHRKRKRLNEGGHR
ncbi:MAG: SCO family protein [Nitrospirae bacterium]|nr:SCO family protein [Nitrospirota bacterium]